MARGSKKGEGSAVDKKQDAAGAKRMGKSAAGYEGSADDRKADAKRKAKAKKKKRA